MKRSLSFALVLCLVLSLFAGVISASAVTYTDVATDFWAYNEIYYLTNKNILQGDGNGKFRPKDSVTHAEFIKMIVSTFNLRETAAVSFTNVPTWVRDGQYLEKAQAQGFLLTRYTRDFDFNSKLSREEAVALIARYLGLDESLAVPSSRYPDYDKITTAYRDYVLRATGAKIVQGDDTGKFEPSRILNRSEALRILYTAAGAIYTGSASTAETGAYKENATINNSANLSGITFNGNVYVTEGAGSVYFLNCRINGNLYIRGNTDVTLDNTTASNVIVNADGARLNLKNNARITNCDVNATTAITIDGTSTIDTLAMKTGSRNSTVSGTGSVDQIGVRDNGIVVTGVQIKTRYVVSSGYFVTIDGQRYEGQGKPTAFSAKVYGFYNTINGNNTSTISVDLTVSVPGTAYLAVWPKTAKALSVTEIYAAGTNPGPNVTTAASKVITVAGTSTIPFSAIPGSFENYNVGLIFLPAGTASLQDLKAYYNADKITATATAMVTTAPAASAATKAPTWTLDAQTPTSVAQSNSILVVKFDQRMFYKSAAYNGTTTLTNLELMSASTTGSVLSVYKQASSGTVGSLTPINNFTTTMVLLSDNGSYYNVIYIQLPEAIINGDTYTVVLSSNIVNESGTAPATNSMSYTAGSGSSAIGSGKPTLTTSTGTNYVTNNDYVTIGVPTEIAGVRGVRYNITVDGKSYTDSYVGYEFTETSRRFYFTNIQGTKIEITAYPVDSNMQAIGNSSNIATATYYLTTGQQQPVTSEPSISVNGVAYKGTNAVAYVNGGSSYTISSTAIPANYNAYLTITDSLTGTQRSVSTLDGTYNQSATYSMVLRPAGAQTSQYDVTTTVTVYFTPGSSGGTTPTPAPTGTVPTVTYNGSTQGSTITAGSANEVVVLNIIVPSNSDLYYVYALDGENPGLLTNGAANRLSVTNDGLVPIRQLTITAYPRSGSSAGGNAGQWDYMVYFPNNPNI